MTVMEGVTDPVTQTLLDDWQRDFPIVPRPFDRIGTALDLSAAEVIARLRGQIDNGRVTRVGATCAPNTISASTLAAMAVPEDGIADVAQLVGAQPGVNHSYLREDRWNLWFVATGPDRAHVDAALARIEAQSGLRVLDLRLVRPFNVDLGFAMRRASPVPKRRGAVDTSVIRPDDRALIQALMTGLPLTRRPYLSLAETLGRTEDEILDRIAILSRAGVIARLGVIVRHRALGWRSNAMVVWDMGSDAITAAGPKLAAHPGVTLCYERVPVPGVWPYRLYSMIHARSRGAALDVLSGIAALPEFAGVPHKALFSVRCFKQTGALIDAPGKETA